MHMQSITNKKCHMIFYQYGRLEIELYLKWKTRLGMGEKTDQEVVGILVKELDVQNIPCPRWATRESLITQKKEMDL